MSTSYTPCHRTANGLSHVEKFVFSLVRSATCHSISMPIHRYGTVLQVKNTMMEMSGDVDLFDSIDSYNLLDRNNMMAIYYRTCLLLTSHGTSSIFKERIKRKINVQRTDKRAVRILKRVTFSTITRIITFSFGHYFSFMQSLCSIDKLPPDRRWRFGFTQRGFGMLCMTTIIDQLLWYSSYYIFAPHLKKTIHSKIRTYCSNLFIYPLYSIMRRQMLTDENMLNATRSLYNNYGLMSFFDGALCEILRSVIYDLSGKMFDFVLKKYVLWKYDVYGIQNTILLSKEYVQLMQRDDKLIHGFIRECIEKQQMEIYIPNHLIQLIERKFLNEKEYQITDSKLRDLVVSLSEMEPNRVNRRHLNALINNPNLQRTVKDLFENRKFQKLWKQKIVHEMMQTQRNKEHKHAATINNRYNGYYFGSKTIVFYCDLCSSAIDSKRMCRFKKCGHCLCTQCRRRLRLKRKCGVCQQRITPNKNYYYLITHVKPS
eukprot:202189_1